MRADVSKVLFAGDWHGNLGWATYCVGMAKAARVDAIVQLGDFGIWPGRAGQRYLVLLEIALASADLTCYFIDGNHEDFPQLLDYPLDDDGTRVVRPHIRHLPRGHRWEWSGLSFMSLGGAVSLDRKQRTPMVEWWPQEHLSAEDVAGAIDGGPVDVLLTHDAPHDVDIPGLPVGWDPEVLREAEFHRELLSGVCDAVTPLYLLHGHFHIAYTATRGETRVTGLDTDGLPGNTMISDLGKWGRR